MMHSSFITARSPDPIPRELSAFLNETPPCPGVERSEEEPANKRRKTSQDAQDKISIEKERWKDHLTLARVEIKLTFAHAKTREISSPQRTLPSNRPIKIASLKEVGQDKYLCVLKTSDWKPLGAIRLCSTISPDTFQALQNAIHLNRNFNKRSYFKVIFFIKETGLASQVRYKLETSIIWRNSQSLKEAHTDHTLVWLTSGKRSGQDEAWSPRDFYDNVYVPDKSSQEADSMQVVQLQCELYPFQKRAVQWLLNREGVDIKGKQTIVGNSTPVEGKLPHGFFRAIDVDGKKCFVNHWLGIVTTNERILELDSQIHGGILAEEMGLGKTVELLALICLHRAPSSASNRLQSETPLQSSSTTLIITPPSILQQWQSEIETLAPGLKVMVYGGIRGNLKKDNDKEGVTELLSHDIVLTTYQIIASEIYYSGAVPDRNLRKEKKYERRQSPLMQIAWWRVILDECQMVESGVSNAAKVAQLIPRENAWAVSGTPLKKDAKDLLGLLIFLRYEPYCNSAQIWHNLISQHKPILGQLFRTITLRHTKEQVKEDIQLPTQKRIIMTVPFTQIEETHYSALYQQMCEECGLDTEGAPLMDTWDPNNPALVEKMRTWLTRLRQTCLHPEVGDRNRRALGHGDGPLRTVGEVLQVMMEQNETASRTEERSLLLSQIRRGQLLENAGNSQEALQTWLKALEQSRIVAEDCRKLLDVETQKMPLARTDLESTTSQEPDKNLDAHTGMLRLRLRSALEVEHISTFFVANAYYQIKTDVNLTTEDSKQYQDLEKSETDMYEKAKLLRKEMLSETHAKADTLMKNISSRAQDQDYVQIPNYKPLAYSGGIESRNVLMKLEELYDIMNTQAEQLDEWREKMIELLLLPLVDQEEAELQGDEYETSTKQQDDVYVYMEVLRAVVADRHDALTGQRNELINHEIGFALQKAREGQGHSPDLLKRLMAIRGRLKPAQSLGSIRGIITELRTLKTTLRSREGSGSSRVTAEANIIDSVLQNLQSDNSRQAKAVAGLERELEIYRDTMNARLEYYRQLQTISDAVAPYEEDHSEDAVHAALELMERNEVRLQSQIAKLKARGRYLIHLRNESTAEDTQQMCIICQQPFEIGALTSCGHSYCKECLRLWWNAHRNCPTCKKHLSKNDFHQISYKPLEFTMQEESQSKTSSASAIQNTSIYSGISSITLNQIRNIDVEGSFGTKIDTLARHLLWIRDNDPGAKSIVFSQFKDFLDVLARAFAKFKIGFTSIDKKDGIEKFKKDPSVECFFLHAKAHSSGLNLVNATHVFLCEPLVNTAIELQAIARVHRIGQHHPTTVWMYIVEDTVEKAIYDISVNRRLSHLSRTLDHAETDEINSPQLVESRIEAANSLQLQEAPFSKLLTKGLGGGEMVDQSDLWNCLFQQKAASRMQISETAEQVITRYLGGVAAEERRL